MNKLKELLLRKKSIIEQSQISQADTYYPQQNNNLYRLHFFHSGNMGEKYLNGIKKEIIAWYFPTFTAPANMELPEVQKIISYLIKKIENDYNLPECSLKALSILNETIENFLFQKVETQEKPIELFTISGDIKEFNKQSYSKEYFDWFIENVSLDEVKTIYEKYGLTFPLDVLQLKKTPVNN